MHGDAPQCSSRTLAMTSTYQRRPAAPGSADEPAAPRLLRTDATTDEWLRQDTNRMTGGETIGRETVRDGGCSLPCITAGGSLLSASALVSFARRMGTMVRRCGATASQSGSQMRHGGGNGCVTPIGFIRHAHNNTPHPASFAARVMWTLIDRIERMLLVGIADRRRAAT